VRIPPPHPEGHRHPNAGDRCRGSGSEGVEGPELYASGIRDRASRVVAQGGRRISHAPAAEVLRVEHVVDIESDAKVLTGELREILLEPEIDALIGPPAGDEAVRRRWREAPVREGLSRHAPEAGRTAGVRRRATPERQEPAELQARNPGHVDDPVADDPLALVLPAIGRMLRDGLRVRESARE